MIDNDKISNSQMWMVIVLTVLGMGIFSLPRTVVETTETDGWITVIVGGLVALVNFYIMSRLAKLFPGDTIVEIVKKVLGKYLAIPFIISFWAYIVSIIAMTLRVFGEVIKMSLLISTPIEVIMISFLILALMLSRGGVEPIVRFSEVVFPIIFITLVFLSLAAIPGSDFTNVLPIMGIEPQKFLMGVYQTIYSYGGYEFILLIIPFIKKPDRIFRSAIPAFVTLIVTYSLAVAICLAKFGVDNVKDLVWPTLTLVRTIDIPGSFIERLEGFIMMQWVLFAFTTIAPFTYGAAQISSKLLGHREFKHFCAIIIPLVYVVALMPDNVVEVYKYQDFIVQYLGTPSVFVLPVLLLIVASIRKMGVRKNA